MKLSRFVGVCSMLLLLSVLAWPQGPSPHSATLIWTASATAGVSYNAYRGAVAGGPYTKVGTTAALTFVDSSGIGGTRYFYVVTAFNSGGESAPSNEITVVFLGNPAPPAGLQGVAN